MFDKRSFENDDEFSWQNALNCALASQLAYSDAAEVEAEAVGKWGYDHCSFFDVGSTQGFVAWDSEFVLLSYRGTKELGGWLVHLNVARTTRPYGKVHSGFLSGFEDTKDLVQQLFEQADVSNKKLWVTGHSLGGALASMMAAEMLDDPALSAVYTFGQPRVVNRKAVELFRQNYDGKFFRLVNDDDVVAKLPALLKQVGSIIWFDPKGELKESPPGVRADEFGPEALSEEEMEEQQMMFRSLKRQINKAQEAQAAIDVDEISEDGEMPEGDTRGLLPSLTDHFMANYIKKIHHKIATT